MKYFVLTYDPKATTEPSVQEFSDSPEAFRVLEEETLEHRGKSGIEVVLFYCDSEATLRAANQRYFNPEATHRLREHAVALRRSAEQLVGTRQWLSPASAGREPQPAIEHAATAG